MADSYHIIDGKVVPYSGGRKCNDTDAWRDATPLELQLQEQLAEYEHANAAQKAEIETLRAEVERLNRLLGRIVEGDGDSTLTIRAGTDAFAAAREYLSAHKPESADQVHVPVPEPEQPTDLWRCTVCGQVSTVGRCCGEETREPFRPLR